MVTKQKFSDRIEYLNEKGQRHREDGPAIEWNNGSKEWYINGQCHREDGPAVEFSNGGKAWCINGKRHREDRPAREYSNGTKAWYINGYYYTEQEFYHELLKLFHERLKEDPESVELKGKIKNLETKLTAKKYGL